MGSVESLLDINRPPLRIAGSYAGEDMVFGRHWTRDSVKLGNERRTWISKQFPSYTPLVFALPQVHHPLRLQAHAM